MSRVLSVSSPRLWVPWCGVLEGGLSSAGLHIWEWDVFKGGSSLWCIVRSRSFMWPPSCVVLAFVKIYIMYYSLSFLSMHCFVVVENSWPSSIVRPPWRVLLVYYSLPRCFISNICVLLSSWLRISCLFWNHLCIRHFMLLFVFLQKLCCKYIAIVG